MSKPDGGPAFPKRTLVSGTYKEDGEFVPIYDDSPGMSLRDYFAAKALPALLAETYQQCRDSGTQTDVLAAASIASYAYADAMLEAREK